MFFVLLWLLSYSGKINYSFSFNKILFTTLLNKKQFLYVWCGFRVYILDLCYFTNIVYTFTGLFDLFKARVGKPVSSFLKKVYPLPLKRPGSWESGSQTLVKAQNL